MAPREKMEGLPGFAKEEAGQTVLCSQLGRNTLRETAVIRATSGLPLPASQRSRQHSTTQEHFLISEITADARYETYRPLQHVICTKCKNKEQKRKEKKHTHTHNGKVASGRSHVQCLKIADGFR